MRVSSLRCRCYPVPHFGGIARTPLGRPQANTCRPWFRPQSGMTLLEAAWDSFSAGSPMRRAGRAGFARNICVGLGNWDAPDAVPALTSALSDPEPVVRAHAAWALGRVGSAEAKSALSAAASVETDATVLEELSAAMAA